LSSNYHISSGKPDMLSTTKRWTEDQVMELEEENARLQRLITELLLKNQQLRDAYLPSQRDNDNFDQNRAE
ncbi:MAG TPA: hypothetical protein VGM27_29860, partial [Acidobacteriaceae bacterium]